MRKRLRDMSLHRRVIVRSAGTRVGQRGRKPDIRAIRVAEAAGVSLGGIRSSQVTVRELVLSDRIVAMDRANQQDLLEICPLAHQHKICLLTDFTSGLGGADIPDPYFGSAAGFTDVYWLMDAALAGLLDEVVQQLG